MAFNVIEASKKITNQYKRYLRTIFDIADPEYKQQFIEQLENADPFSKGPYLDVVDSFEKGKSVKGLIEEGVLNDEFVYLNDIYQKTLYVHQEQALRKVNEGKNLVVSTGTGSGKTECFLIPIINRLMREKKANGGVIEPGVRALLIYPMNALANDQIDRLRRTLSNYKDITFGCYTGQTEYTKEKALSLYKKLNKNPLTGEEAEPLENEILSREEMKDKPPHILITNYAMLEYLMLRPEDSVFFDGQYAKKWAFIVLDEAHTYTGSTGIEVSMLLRRVTAKLNNPKLQYILTSATLGDKDSDEDVVKFAENLCTAPFNTQDIVRATRIDLTKQASYRYSLTNEFYDTVADLVDYGYTDSCILKKINEAFGFEITTDTISEFLFDLLLQDRTYWKIKDYLSSPKSVENICAYTGFTNSQITNFVEVASRAMKNRTKLFDSRYHLFIRATEGVFITLAPHKSLQLSRKSSEFYNGQEYKVFEVVTCAQCHSLYILGKKEGDYLIQNSSWDPQFIKEAYLIGDTVSDNDEDDSLETENLTTETYELCPYCGFIRRSNEVHKRKCQHNDADYVKLVKVKTSQLTGRVTKCVHCEGVNSLGILRSFFSGQEASTSVIGTALFGELPHNEREVIVHDSDDFDDGFGDVFDEHVIEKPKAKQFIAFSDSRQAAAYFASYFSETYEGFLYGRLINDKVKALGGLKKSVPRFVYELATTLQKSGIAPFAETMPDFEAEAWKAVLKELVDNRSRNSLISLGLLNIDFADDIVFTDNKKFVLTCEDVKNICSVFIMGMLSDVAIYYDKELTSKDIEFFAHNGVETTYLSNGANSAYVRSFIPKTESKTNKRKEYLERILQKKGLALTQDLVVKLLEGFWRICLKMGIFKNVTTKFGSEGYKVNTDKLCLTRSVKWYRCPHCQRLTPYNVDNVCPSYMCDGILEPVDVDKLEADNHYYRMYNELDAQPMRVVEHTAQLNREEAYNYQNLFKQKKIDVLSCSTTFEMGVDVGELETVFMRNMPPSPSNYAQRAGRAGRSTKSAAFALTFCNKSNHDFNFFKDPITMIKGVIKPPTFKIDNEKICIRHVYASAFSFFWRAYPKYFKTAQEMMEDGDYGENGYAVFKRYLESKPDDLKAYLINSVPASLIELYKVEDFGWIKWLFDEPDVNYPNFKRVYKLYTDEINALLEDKLNAEKADKNSDYIRFRIKNYRNENIISFLSKNSILPKYGFPVDTVQLSVNDRKDKSGGLDLSRDLSIAISEYAPGCQVVANGKLITSRYIRKVPNEHWKMYDYIECGDCQTLNIEIHTEADSPTVLKKCKQCGKIFREQEKQTFITPDFGFIADSKIETPTLIKPERTYRSEAAFVNYTNEIPEVEYTINEVKLHVATVNNGPMVIRTTGDFFVCQTCGYAEDTIQSNSPFFKRTTKSHKSPSGRTCKCTELDKFSLGYRFETDVIRIKIDLPCNSDEAYSVLQALILATCYELNIDNNEIAGCLQYCSGGMFYYILYDTTPGGAGHVKRLNNSDMIARVLNSAYYRAHDCICGNTDGDSSCYSCLRTYQNQKYHDIIKRKYVIDYLGFAK